MNKNLLEMFGKILMEKVRDQSIMDWDMILDGRMKGHRANDVRQRLKELDQNQMAIIGELVPLVVDTVLHHLLWTLEQESAITVKVMKDGVSVPSIRDASDGLAGEICGKNGWISKFSQQRNQEGS